MKCPVILVILFVTLLVSCCPWQNVADDYDPRFEEIPALGLTAPTAVGGWITKHVRYISDPIHDVAEYWQSPDQTYVWRAGDCEDFVILMMYLVHVELEGWPQMAIGILGMYGHAWVIYKGRWYEAQGGMDVTNDPDYTLIKAIPYGEAMWRSMNGHKNLGRTP